MTHEPATPVLSGALHYFRVHPELWADRLARCAAMGLTTIETYVPWNFHETYPGRRSFDGWRDVEAFIRLVAEHGLSAIVRPGPYICAEWDLGGLPAWLLADRNVRLRCLDPAYLRHVDAWFDELIPRLVPLQQTYGGPIAAIQVENEYGSYGSDSAYLEHLRDGLARRGVNVPLFTSDGPTELMLSGGTLPGVWKTANFGSDAVHGLQVLRAHDPGGPLMCMEFWNGWFDHWGEPHHQRDAEDAAAELEAVLGEGASVNVYMAHGGTNFGLWAGANLDGDTYQPTVTSYDYDAPIGEAGELTEKYSRFRAIFSGMTGVTPPEPPPDRPRLAPRTIALPEVAPLLPVLRSAGSTVEAPEPLAMEEVGVPAGVMHYATRLPAGVGTVELDLGAVHDRAYVRVDGQHVGVVERNDPHPLPLTLDTAATLEVLVESFGRVNYGTAAPDRKGLLGPVWLGHQLVHGWTITALDLLAPLAIDYPAGSAPGAPCFRRGLVSVDESADGFLALPGWGSGIAWLNGFCLGRYRADGPQRTLYAPAPLWREGDNEIVVLEFSQVGAAVELRAQPEL